MIKTIKAWNSEEFDKLVNEFEADPKNSVFATQTHIQQIQTNEGSEMYYIAVIFYKVRP